MKQITTFGASDFTIDDLELFRDIDDPAVAALLAGCAIVRVPLNAAILEDTQARLYIVLSGALGVQADPHAEASGATAPTRIQAGECFGELSVLDNAANSSSAVALQESDLLVIDATTVWKLIDQCNGVARNLLRLLSFRVRAANAQIRRRQKVGEFYRQLSMVDGLTGLYNRAWLNDILPALVRQAEAGQPLSLIMIDLDHFKKFNDEHGHLAGDAAIKMAAQVIGAALRPSDYAARYGGEELIVILPDTDLDVAVMIAERLCERMQHAVVFADMHLPLPHMTASFGVASLSRNQDGNDLIAAADAALYRAKHGGRNRVAR